METLAIITARGGSKGLPRKNIRDLGGKPLIAWAIESALDSEQVGRVIVSTDDAEIAAVSSAYGAEVPFIRPYALAQDTTTTMPVILHAIACLEKVEGYFPDIVLHMQPTTPFAGSDNLDEAVSRFANPAVDAVVSVCEVDHSPYWFHHVDSACRMTDFLDQTYETQRQDHQPVYRRNGAFYIAKTNVLHDDESFYKRNVFAHVMNPQRSTDIDTEIDLRIAETLLSEHPEFANNQRTVAV